MQRAYRFRRKLTLAGILLTGLLFCVFWFAFRSIRRADSMNALMVHTQDVLQHAEQLRLLRASLQNNYWAFLYTRTPRSLEAFRKRREELRETLSRMRALTRAIPQQAILDQLAPLLNGEADNLAAHLEQLASSRSSPSVFFVDASLAIPADDDTSRLIDQFEANEAKLFRVRSLAVQQSAHLAANVLVVAGVLSFVILLAAGHLIQREVIKRATVEVGLRRAQEILGVRFEEQRTELGNAVEDLHAQIRARKTAEEKLRRLNEDLEDRVRARTSELQDLNMELEAFTYSVSHDLRAPLRHMDGFSRILQTEFGPQLPAEAGHYLDRLRAAASNMSNLVEDLLRLSRVGRQLPQCQRTSLLALAEDARGEILSETTGRVIHWKLQPLPEVDADPVLLRQVFANLFSNAVKFTRKQPAPVIEVGSRWEQDSAVVFVKDNGAGFDPRYADKLFGVFQRLHRQDEYEGTGIGLATVQRIIHKHGGKVWAESQPGCGATFYFSLPGAGKATPSETAAIGAVV